MPVKGGEKMWTDKVIGEISIATGETASLGARIAGEMLPGDIPLNPGIDLAALKSGDAESMEVVVEVPAGKSKRGWNYKPEALQAIVGEVMAQGLPGFLGHQKPEDVDNQFPTPVTHWVGAKWDETTRRAYFRGVVDKAAADLKRWIKGKTIKTVSIFGIPKLQKVAGGETNVVDYKPLSIDWTPLGRAGMPTAVVATGEMVDEIAGELDGSHEELREALAVAVKAYLGNKENEYVWVQRVYDAHVIVKHEGKKGTRLYRIPYGIVDDEVKLGEKSEVVKKEVYEPVGEIYGGETSMSWKELVAKLKAMLAAGDATLGQVVGEMGLSADAVAGEMAELKTALTNAGTLAKVQEALGINDGDDIVKVAGEIADTLAKTKKELGVTGEMDIVETAKEAAKARSEHQKATHQAMVKEVLGEKVSGEMAQALVMKMVDVPENASKEQVSGEIDRVLADETIKDALSKLFVDKPAFTGNSGGSGNSVTTGILRKRTSSI